MPNEIKRGDNMVQEERTNDLVQYRKRMKFTQPEVARLLGWKNIKGLCDLEGGRATPTLITAFKLGIIYRAPIEFLFKDRYEALRNEIRAKEAKFSPVGQQAL